MPAPPHDRLRYDDVDRLRRDARELLESNDYGISWGHIFVRGHEVSEAEIRDAFYFGSLAPSQTTPGRCVATHQQATSRVLHVVFEIQRVRGGKHLVVVTAYPEGGP